MMSYLIDFVYKTDFILVKESSYTQWIHACVDSENFMVGELTYYFVNDEELLALNKKEFRHDYYTDIITFDLSIGKLISADIFISINRVKENALLLTISFEEELRRVMVHGILHCMGYKDKTTVESTNMRRKEEEKMLMFHVEQ